MPLTKLGRQIVIGSTCLTFAAVLGGVNYVVHEMTGNQDLRLWMRRRYPRLLEAFYRSYENLPDSSCWYRTWDEQVIKEEEENERTKR